MAATIRLSLFLSLCLLPVVAFAGQDVQPLFLDTANCGPMVSPAGATAPVEAPMEGAILLSSCSATAECSDGTILSCTGTSTCSAQDGSCGSVTCDGNTTSCPLCVFCSNQLSNCNFGCGLDVACGDACIAQFYDCVDG